MQGPLRFSCSHAPGLPLTHPTPASPHPPSQCVIVEPVVNGAELAQTLDMLAKLAVRVSGGGSVLHLVEEARRLTM